MAKKMKMTVLLKKFQIEKKEFITSTELKEYCKSFGFDYTSLVRYLERRGHLVRIFHGIFYIRSSEDLEKGKLGYNHLELVAQGLKLKKIENWYFGLHTALKLNNLTHEHFTVEEVINNKITRSTPMTIADYKFKFIKTPKSLLKFGIIKKNKIRYSDAERTIIDFIYIWKQNSVPSEKILHDISDWLKDLSKDLLYEYSLDYPKSVRTIVEMIK